MSKEILCPVCGEEMREDDDLYIYDNKGCPVNEFFQEEDIDYINRQIQSKIDRAEEEAVRAKDVEIAALREALRVAETGVKNRDVILDSIRNSKKVCPKCHDRGKVWDNNGGYTVCPCHLE